MQDLNATIAENLKNIRKSRGLSLDNVAAQTGVSKSMLGQIERLEVNPTITTIWKIANGLKVNFSTLLQTSQPEHEIIDSQEMQSIDTADGKYHLLPLFAFSDQRNFDLHRVVINPGGRLDSDPHAAGTQEYLVVYTGELTLNYGEHALKIRKGQAIRFAADVPHNYSNEGKCDVDLCMYISYKTD